MGHGKDNVMEKPSVRVDGYLSRLAQNCWKDALVVCLLSPGAETWQLERPGVEPVGLGESFSQAKQAVHAVVSAERNREDRGNK